MSITFWAPDAPPQLVTPYEDEPDYQEQRSTLPELNLANDNAQAFLALLEIPWDWCGTIAVAEFDKVIPRLLVLANSEDARQPVLRPGEQSQAVRVEQDGNLAVLRRGPRMYGGGLLDDPVQRYAQTLLALLMRAKQQGYCVSWG
jgi:hypothetical protein